MQPQFSQKKEVLSFAFRSLQISLHNLDLSPGMAGNPLLFTLNISVPVGSASGSGSGTPGQLPAEAVPYSPFHRYRP